MLALFRKTNSRHPRTEASSAGPRPGTMARGSPRALRCSCQTIRHANVPHGVLKEPSKRRRSLKPQSHKPLKDSPLWIHSAMLGLLSPNISRRVKQRGQQVQQRTDSKYSTGISSTQAVALWRRCRECVHEVDNSPEGQSSENNARNERRTVRSRLRYHLGPYRPE